MRGCIGPVTRVGSRGRPRDGLLGPVVFVQSGEHTRLSPHCSRCVSFLNPHGVKSAMQVRKLRDTLSTLKATQIDLDRRTDTTLGHCASLSLLDLTVAEDVGEALDQGAGLSSKGTEVAVALDLALYSDTVRDWVLSRMAEKQNSMAHAKVTLKFIFCSGALRTARAE